MHEKLLQNELPCAKIRNLQTGPRQCLYVKNVIFVIFDTISFHMISSRLQAFSQKEIFTVCLNVPFSVIQKPKK